MSSKSIFHFVRIHWNEAFVMTVCVKGMHRIWYISKLFEEHLTLFLSRINYDFKALWNEAFNKEWTLWISLIALFQIAAMILLKSFTEILHWNPSWFVLACCNDLLLKTFFKECFIMHSMASHVTSSWEFIKTGHCS